MTGMEAVLLLSMFTKALLLVAYCRKWRRDARKADR